MYFTQEKLETRIRLLEELRYSELQDLFPVAVSEDIRPEDEVVQWPPQKGKEEMAEKHHFLKGRNKYYWLEKRVTLPKVREGFQVVGLFDMGKTGAGTNSGFESLLYINGEGYQAVDTNHKEVFFEKEFLDKETELSFLLWSGLEGGGVHKEQFVHLQEAKICYMHTATDAFYFLGKAIFKALRYMRDEDEEKCKLKNALNRAVMSIDFSEDRETLYFQTEAAYYELLEELDSMKKRTDITVHCIGHTHIDVAWLWRLKHTKEKAQRSFSTVLRYMDQFEDYKFVQSQPQLYAYVKENSPKLYGRMKQYIEEGRFEPEGAMWLEADCNISSGEALVRQIVEGEKFFEAEFHKKSTCLWLPDVFGYSVALPQILRECNIRRFVTTKISWNEYNKMPHDTFYWKGLDGSEILTYFVTTPEEGRALDDKYATYNGQISPRTVLGSWKKYEDKGINQDILLTYGYGDGGGGPTRTMLMMRRALDLLPGIPNVKQTGVGEFLDKVEENLSKAKRPLPVWRGELYLENHRGTYTSQGKNKRFNRKTEFSLVEMEMQNVFCYLYGEVYYEAQLENMWRTLLLNQFHDILPGSSIPEVYKDSCIQYEDIRKELLSLQETMFQNNINHDENQWNIFNPLGYSRTEAVWIPEKREGFFRNKINEILKSQKQCDGYWVELECPALSYTQISFEESPGCKVEKTCFHYQNNILETPFYRITWNQDGIMDSIYDKDQGREVLRGLGNRLTVYEDRPYNNDAWNIDLFHKDKYEVVQSPLSLKVAEDGSLRFVLEAVYSYRSSTITQKTVFYAGDRRIDFETKACWHENHRLLKTCFEVNVDSLYAQYDVQFGNVTRTTHYNTSWDYAKFEVPAQKWADYSETGYGTSLLNDCKYGYSVHENQISLSLIKCATFPDPGADQGEHEFTYSFLPHTGTWQEAGVNSSAERLNQPVTVKTGICMMSGRSLFKLNGGNITVDAVKKAEKSGDIILRIHEYKGMRGKVTIDSDFKILSYGRTNLLEEERGERQKGECIKTYINPYEIQTFVVSFV